MVKIRAASANRVHNALNATVASCSRTSTRR